MRSADPPIATPPAKVALSTTSISSPPFTSRAQAQAEIQLDAIASAVTIAVLV